MLTGLVEVIAVEDNVGSLVSHRLNLERICIFGEADDRPGAKELASIGDRLAMVARGCCDNPLGSLLRTHVGQQVDPATHLESSQGLVILMLQAYIGIQ